MSGKLVIFSGPSGVGKDTVLDAWTKRNPRVQRVIAYTTRPMRVGEVDGIDYKFVTVEDFRSLISQEAFLEYKEVFGNLYGTPLIEMSAMLASNQVAVLKIDVQGAMLAMKLRPDALSVFVLPPSFEELERRITERGKDDPEVIERRLRVARDEIALAPEYQHQVVNSDVENVVDHLEGLIS